MILDEEQRFGVAQKELLKSLRLEVDVLTLARRRSRARCTCRSPGMRDISMIETPPEGRRPIRTTWASTTRSSSSSRSSARRSARARRSTSTTASRRSRRRPRKLQQLCPGLRFLVAHGQMREKELEERMHSFLRGDADVLVSTTIIESGIDIPQANTLIVERADMLGLAQLYQIRGRVGRSDATSYAYLFYPDARELTPEARARLATLADHTELGAGFAIAMRDLEIRGAGELLGAEQSGHVAAVGFELYVELLNEAVAELQGQRRVAARPVRVDARVDAYVPAAYVAFRGAPDRRPPPARAGRDRGRAARAPGGARGPLRAAARAGREPLPDPGGEDQARARSAPTTSSSGAARPRSAGWCSARASCASSATGAYRPSTSG